MKKISTNIYTALLYQLGIAFTILHLTRYIFYLLNLSYFPSIGSEEWASIIYGGLRFDLAATLYTNSIFILLQILPIPYRHNTVYKKVSGIVYLLSNIIMLAFSVADMVYFKFTLRRSTWMIFKEFSNEKNISNILLQSIGHYWYTIPLLIGLATILVILFKRVTKSIEKPAQTYYIHAGNFVMLFSIPILFVGGVRGDFKYSTRPITMSNAGEYTKNPALIPLVLNTPFCMLRTISQQFYNKESFIIETDLDKYYNPIQKVSENKEFKYDNVVIIILESFGMESIGFYNKGLDGGRYKGYSPFLDSLLENGLTSYHSFANGRKSIDALPSVLMSIPSGEIPFILTPYASNKTESLPAILKSKGYTTAFFHGAPNGSMGFKALMNLIGVDRYYGKDEYGRDEDFDGTWGIWDEPFFQYSAETMNGLKEPFMSTIFSVSSHEPFKVPSKYVGKFPKGDHPLRELIGYTDLSLKRFFARAEKMSWFKRTLFVITGDHASIPFYPEYKTSWGKMTVPVLFYHPGDSSIRKKEKGVIQQTDVMPTVLSYLHYDKPFLAFGRNVLDEKQNKIAFNYIDGFQLFRDQYMLQMNGKEASGLYNYIEDPLLQKNLINAMKPKKDSMELTIKAVIQQYHNRLIEDRLTANTSDIH